MATTSKTDPVKDFFLELFDYNLNCNETLIHLLYENEKQIDEKIISLFNHIVNAHQIWNNRIQATETPYSTWEIHKFADLDRLNKNNHEVSRELVSDFPASEIVDYKTSRGESYSNTVKDILFHVINHSTYHRAQIASELKKTGIQPPVSDYIFYKR